MKILSKKFLKYEISKHMKFFCEISSNWPNDVLGTNVYKTLESC